MKGSKVYIYGLMDGDNIIYVGKSVSPRARLANHKQNYNTESLKLIILDFFIDKEIYWVNKLLSEGHKLHNKEFLMDCQECEIGEIIECRTKTSRSVLNKETNQIYESIYKLSQEINLDNRQILLRINNPEKYPEFNKYKLI